MKYNDLLNELPVGGSNSATAEPATAELPKEALPTARPAAVELPTAQQRRTYGDWLGEWLSVCVKPTVKQRTYEKYERICRTKLSALGEYALERLTAPVLQKFVAEMTARLSPNSVNVVISVLKSSLKRAVALGVTEREYTGGLSRPHATEKKIECFSIEEQKKMEASALNDKNKNLVGVLLCLYTGLRIGELLALTWEDIDFSSGILSVTKSCHDGWGKGCKKIVEAPKTGSSTRLIPIPKPLLGILKKTKREIGGTYVVGGNKLISVRSYQRTFELLQKKLRIARRGFHALRHTFATRAIECGVDVRTLAELLGHKNPTVTLNRYVHSLMAHKQMMMNRLGKLLI